MDLQLNPTSAGPQRDLPAQSAQFPAPLHGKGLEQRKQQLLMTNKCCVMYTSPPMTNPVAVQGQSSLVARMSRDKQAPNHSGTASCKHRLFFLTLFKTLSALMFHIWAGPDHFLLPPQEQMDKSLSLLWCLGWGGPNKIKRSRTFYWWIYGFIHPSLLVDIQVLLLVDLWWNYPSQFCQTLLCCLSSTFQGQREEGGEEDGAGMGLGRKMCLRTSRRFSQPHFQHHRGESEAEQP